jgi:hypothetical protein
MTDQQYGDYEFEIYFDGVEGPVLRLRSFGLT